MNCCDRCDIMPDEMNSLDGMTLLCAECAIFVLEQQQKLKKREVSFVKPVQRVWDWLMNNAIAFREEITEETNILVYFGSRDLMDIMEQLSDWEAFDTAHFDPERLRFSKREEGNDIDGGTIETAHQAFCCGDVVCLLESFGCWYKVQFIQQTKEDSTS